MEVPKSSREILDFARIHNPNPRILALISEVVSPIGGNGHRTYVIERRGEESVNLVEKLVQAYDLGNLEGTAEFYSQLNRMPRWSGPNYGIEIEDWAVKFLIDMVSDIKKCESPRSQHSMEKWRTIYGELPIDVAESFLSACERKDDRTAQREIEYLSALMKVDYRKEYSPTAHMKTGERDRSKALLRMKTRIALDLIEGDEYHKLAAKCAQEWYRKMGVLN